MKKITALFVVLVMISLLPVAFIMSEMGPERAWTQVSLYITIFAALLALYAGRALKNKYETNTVIRLYAAFATLYVIATGTAVVLQAGNYSKAYDDRIVTIIDHKNAGGKETLLLKQLPSSGWIHSAEVSEDTTHFNNVFLKEFLQLNFPVAAE